MHRPFPLSKFIRSLPTDLLEELECVIDLGGSRRSKGRTPAGGKHSSKVKYARSLTRRMQRILHSADLEPVEELLHALRALDLKLAYAAAIDLMMDSRKEHVDLARSFADSLPESAYPVPACSIAGETDVRSLQTLLVSHRDKDVRLEAAERLIELGRPSALDALRHCAKDPVGEVVRSVLMALHERFDRGRKADSLATSILYEGDASARQAAAEFLGRVAEDRSTLHNAVKKGFPEVAEAAALAIVRWQFDGFMKSSARNCNPWRMRRGFRRVEWIADNLRRIGVALAKNSHLVEKSCLGKTESALASFLQDEDEQMRLAGLLFLAAWRPTSWPRHVHRMLKDPEDEVRRQAVGILGKHGRPSDQNRIIGMLKDDDYDVQVAAIDALAKLAKERKVWFEPVKKRLEDRTSSVRGRAVRVLGKLGEPADLDRVLEMLNDTSGSVRIEALQAAVGLAPDRAVELATSMVTDPSAKVSKAALTILERVAPYKDSAQLAVDKLHDARGGSCVVLVELIGKLRPETLDDAILIASRSRSADGREMAAELLPMRNIPNRNAILKDLFRDRNEDVREKALEGLKKSMPEKLPILVRKALHDPSKKVRSEALDAFREEEIYLGSFGTRFDALYDPSLKENQPPRRILAADDDPHLVEDLLPLARDEDSHIRYRAIRALAKFDDMRVYNELISSLNDVDGYVSELAAEILMGKHGSVPILDRIAEVTDPEELWKQGKAEVDGIRQWASRIGRELLGKRVIVHQYRLSIGRTRRDRKGDAVEIHVTDTPVTCGHPHGADIMRGIALHEIGHHLYDFGARGHSTMRGIAKSENIQEIFDILCDERLERILRSRRQEWGAYFDRLSAYAFAQNVHELTIERYAELIGCRPDEVFSGIEKGKLPGRIDKKKRGGPKVALRDADMLAVPGAVPVLSAFLWCLRCGLNPRLHPDTKIAKAIGEVPGNLKDLKHSEVLEAARRIADLIGRTPRHKRDMDRLLRRMRESCDVSQGISKTLDRMAETGQAPEWMKRDAPGIRTSPHASEKASPLESVRPMPGKESPGIVSRIKSGPKGGPSYPPLEKEATLPFDAERHMELVSSIRKHIRRLRGYFECLGGGIVDEYASKRGRRIDLVQARRMVVSSSPNLLVSSLHHALPDGYIGILIDSSSSMAGEKMGLAKAFGALVAESAKAIRGLDGHVNAFDDDTFCRLGDFQRNSIATLWAEGRNNDAGALERAADLALLSRRRHKLILMISDGCPTECSVESLEALVDKITDAFGIVCVQVGVEPIPKVVFPNYVDLSKYPMDEAVARFGRLIVKLSSAWA